MGADKNRNTKDNNSAESNVADSHVLLEIDTDGIAWVTLNRPEVNNAYNREMLEGLAEVFGDLADQPNLRAVVICGRGRHFQAGVDLVFQQRIATMSSEDNDAVSRLIVTLVDGLARFPVPTLALVQGACIGGGTGIVAACDIVLASRDAFFAVAEARWGTHAGPIFPHLAAAIGVRRLRRYALTGERFDAEKALAIGMVHEVCAAEEIEALGREVLDAILACGPEAVRRSKELILGGSGLLADAASLEVMTQAHSEGRQSAEGREGLQSFLDKRRPAWAPDPDRSASRDSSRSQAE